MKGATVHTNQRMSGSTLDLPAFGRALGESSSRFRRGVPLLASLLVCCVMLAPTAAVADSTAPAVLRLERVIDLLSQFEVRLAAVDGEEVGSPARISAGDHIVTLSYATWIPGGLLSGSLVGRWWRARDCMVPLTAEAGHRYVAEVELMNHAFWNCWIRDEDTGEKVRGTLSAQEPTMEGAE